MLENCLAFAIDSYPALFSTKDIRFSSAKASKLRTNRTGLWLGQWWVTSPPPRKHPTPHTTCYWDYWLQQWALQQTIPYQPSKQNKVEGGGGTNWWQDLINAFLLMNRTFFKFTPRPPFFPNPPRPGDHGSNPLPPGQQLFIPVFFYGSNVWKNW